MRNMKILKEIKPIIENNKSIVKEKKANGELFNIFSLLNMEWDEVHTHSPFLAELLNPDGSHGAGNKFLNFFIKEMPLNNVDRTLLQNDSVTVKKEEYIGEVDYKNETGGEIDLLLEFYDTNYAIIIENKISAGDQPAQLARYHNYAKKHYGNRFTLYYLTLDGHDPDKSSTGKETEKHYWTNISYKNGIKNWLKMCLKDDNVANNVKVNIEQYIKIISKLTDQEVGETMDSKIINLMLKNKEEVLEIYNYLDDWKCNLFKDEMKKIEQSTNCKFIIPEDEDSAHPWIWTKRKKYWIYFVPNGHLDCKIWFGRPSNDVPYYYLEKEKTINPQDKLNCMTYDSDKHFKYGSRYLKNEYLSDESNIIQALCNGKFKKYIERCIKQILDDEKFPK